MQEAGSLMNSEVVQFGTEAAQDLGLHVSWREEAKTLIGEVVNDPTKAPLTQRWLVTIRTYGTGVFLVEFDQTYAWEAFAYAREEQIETIGEIFSFIYCYLNGEGESRTVRNWRGKERKFLLLSHQGEQIRLSAMRKKPSA